MSFLDSIGGFLGDVLTGGGVAGDVARIAAMGFALNQLMDSMDKQSDATKPPDYGVREQVDPNTDSNIPIVYGQAYASPVVTDAYMTDDNMTMWYCMTICEVTGKLMSSNQDSVITFNEVYWNENKVVFRDDGHTVLKLVDASGTELTTIDGLVEIYAFNNGSASPARIGTGGLNSTPANGLFPGWTANHTMDNLVFALVKVTYNKDKNVTGIGNLQFKLTNSMHMPGDVLYDYMTNTRYGAGIPPEEIYSA